jgi:hypothetical protein
MGIDMEELGGKGASPIMRNLHVTFLWCYFFFPFISAGLAALFISKGHS